jgi:Ca2+-binding EF-hand superfamily protein
MFYEISQLWNMMTGSISFASTEYISLIFNFFDDDGDGIISFNDYYIIYKEQNKIIGWNEYLNSGKINSKKYT